jgi:hypothetical protein
MRTCAVCGKVISKRDICKGCYREWGNGGEYPEWLEKLLEIHHHFETTKASEEVTFTEIGLDLEGIPLK